MKTIVRVGAALLALVVLLFAIQYLASESGEVVTVRSVAPGGDTKETRLWVVDHAGAQWLRTGNPESQWMARLRAHPEIEVTRDGKTQSYRAVPVPDAGPTVNALMAEKYGVADQIVGVMFSRENVQVVKLEPR